MKFKILISILMVFGLEGCNKNIGLYTQSDIEKERKKVQMAEEKIKKLEQEKNNKRKKEILTKFKCSKLNTVNYTIATGSSTGTYYQIGKDLSSIVANDACMNLKVLTSNGSIENVKRLSKEEGMKLAIVQSDVYQKFKEMAYTGNSQAKNIIKQLKVVKPLYFEEVHFITRADEEIDYIQDIENLKINIGPQGSGTSMTTSTIYKEMFGKHILSENQFSFDYDEALRRLLGGDLDVVVYVVGQPTNRLDLPASAKTKIKFLGNNLNSPMQSSSYYKTKIKQESYKWLDKDIDTLAVKAYLITFDYKGSARKSLARFSFILNEKFDILQSNGHQKWNNVNKELKTLPGGWTYYEPTRFAYNYKFDGQCAQEAKELGLCINEIKEKQ